MKATSVAAVSMDLTVDKTKFNNEIKNSTKNAENAFSNSMKKIGVFVAKAFAAKKVLDFGTSAVKTATKIQSAWTGLNSIVEGTGNSFATAQRFITEYTKDGLVSITEAATAYKNLLARGYDTTQIENTMNALKDSAAFGRQASYDLGEAVVTATEGLKNENSILVDNAGVTKNVAKMWQEWANAHGTTTSDMTQAQKIAAEYNGILKETRFQTGDAATYTKTFGGQLQMLKMSFTNLQVAVGKVIAPIAQLFIPIINSAIVAVTNFFNSIQQLLRTFGLSFPDVVSKTSAGISNVGKIASDTADNIEDTGSAAKKAAKQIKQAFGSVDEINVLNNNKDSSSGGSSDGGSTGTVSTSSMSGEVTKTNSAIDMVVKKFKEVQNLFMKGFNIGFDDTSFDGIVKSIKNIKTSLSRIFTSPEVVNASKNWAKSFIFNLGIVTGSVAKIGTNIAEGLVGSIEIFLRNNNERIRKHIAKMFDIDTKSLNLTGKLFDALGEISEVFSSDIAKQIGSDILSIFTNPLMSITETFNQFILDMQSLFVTPITDNVNLIKQTFEGLLEPIQTVTGTFSDAFTHMGDSLTQVYDEHIKPYYENVKKGLSDSFEKFLKVYNEYFKPFIDETAKDIKYLWDENLKPLWDNVAELVGAIIDHIQLLWEKKAKPFIDWCVKYIAPILVPIFTTIKNTFVNVVSVISGIISGLIKSLTGLIQFVDGVFSGNWDKAWKGIKNIFKGVIDTLWSIFKFPINQIIDGMNTFLKGVSKIKIPDWVPAIGGKGFNFKPIQRLAQGKYIERNNPQLAIIGDNTREGEIVTPESKIYDQVNKALKDNKTSEGRVLELHLYHHYEDGRTIIQKINQAQIDAGEILVMS